MNRQYLGATSGKAHRNRTENGARLNDRLRRGASRFFMAAMCMALTVTLGSAQERLPDVHDEIEMLQLQLDELKTRHGVTPASEDTTDGTEAQFASSRKPHHFSHPKLWAPSCPSGNDSQYPTVRLTGFFQADAGWFDQDPENIEAVGDVQDGADFRRARLAAVGDAWNNVGYMLEMDFAFPGRPSFMDVWLEVRDTMGGNVRVGQFRHPFGMDGLTSVKELTFLERALPFAFTPFRQIGMMYYGHARNENATWAVSGFRFPTDTYGGNVGDNGGFGLAGRLTGLLIDHGDDCGILHVGGGYSFGDPANDVVQYRNQPEFFVSETGGAAQVPVGVPTNVPPFVDTDLIPTNNFNLFNAELAASYGSLYTQSELVYATVNQIDNPSASFSGAYAQAGYFLTGESRPYNRKAGVYGTVAPLAPFGTQGYGAWEIATRWSYIDLNDQNILGGRLNDLTFGLNWYLNRNTKFQFNYIHALLESSPAVNGPIIRDSEANIFAFRGQVAF